MSEGVRLEGSPSITPTPSFRIEVFQRRKAQTYTQHSPAPGQQTPIDAGLCPSHFPVWPRFSLREAMETPFQGKNLRISLISNCSEDASMPYWYQPSARARDDRDGTHPFLGGYAAKYPLILYALNVL